LGGEQARRGELLYYSAPREIMRPSENAHLPFDKPFDKLTVLSKLEGLRYPHPRPVNFSLRETVKPI
jgi:hypothetical protein